MQKNEVSSILVVMVVLWIGIVCAGCITNTPSHNTSGACAYECSPNVTPVPTERHRPDSYWITTNPLANIMSGATINITGETNLPVDTRLWVQVLYPFRMRDKAHSHDIDGNYTVAYVDPGNTSGVNTWMVAVNTTGYTPKGYGTERCEVTVSPDYEGTGRNVTYFYVTESTD
jgi:hypothetical protein